MKTQETYIGRFQIKNFLGQGSRGKVYEGYDELLSRKVAIKVVGHVDQRISPIAKVRLLREARALSKLDHENICRIYDFIEGKDKDYLVLELVEGQTLKALIKTEHLSFGQKLDIVIQVARVLTVTHDESIVHRDLKPENLMITPSGNVKVLDFGLALSTDKEEALVKAQDQLKDLADDSETDQSNPNLNKIAKNGDLSITDTTRTSHGSIVGTVKYMSPEQASSMPASTASDMYALGIIMQELFTGKSPYRGKLSSMALLFKVSQARTRPLDDFDLPPDLADLIRALTKLEPEKRPDAKQTLDTLIEIREKPNRSKKARLKLFSYAGLVALIIGTIWLTRIFSTTAETPIINLPHRTVALLPWSNKTEDAKNRWLEFGGSQMAADVLHGVGHLELVPIKDSWEVLKNMEIDSGEELNDKQLRGLLQTLDSDVVIQVIVTRERALFRFEYKVYSGEGQIFNSKFEGDSLTDMAGVLTNRLHLLLLPEIRKPESSGSYSEDPLVRFLYAMGIQTLNTESAIKARDFFSTASQLAPDFAWARLKLAQVEHMLGHINESKDLLNQIIDKNEAGNDVHLRWEVNRLLGRMALHGANWELANRYFEDCRRLIEKLQDKDLLADHYQDIAEMAYDMTFYQEAETFYRKALEIYQDSGNARKEAIVIGRLGLVFSDTKREKDAEAYLQESIQRSTQLKDFYHVALSYSNLGVLAYQEGDYETAERYYHEALNIFIEIGHPRGTTTMKSNLAGIAIIKGDYQHAESLLLEGLETYKKIEYSEGIARNSYNLAELYFVQNDYERVTNYLETALKWYQEDFETLSLKSMYDYVTIGVESARNWLDKAAIFASEDWEKMKVEELSGIYEEALRTGKSPPLPSPL